MGLPHLVGNHTLQERSPLVTKKDLLSGKLHSLTNPNAVELVSKRTLIIDHWGDSGFLAGTQSRQNIQFCF